MVTFCRGFFASTALLFLSSFPLPPAAAEIATSLDDQTEIAVTIYNEDLALVKDRREVRLPEGQSQLALREVSARIRPETALLRALDDPGDIRVVEQNFDFDLLTPENLLEKYVGRQVQVVRTHPQTGAETIEEAVVLAYNEGTPVLRMGNRIETGVPGRLVFPDVPENLRERPTLVVTLESETGGTRDLELSYLSGGLSWRADYVAELTPADDRLDLTGWVTLTNRSGTSYEDAHLQLVAGDVHRVRDDLEKRHEMQARMTMAAPAAEMAEESLFEYHLYTLGRPTTIGENQKKQVSLLSSSDVPVRKDYVLRGAEYYYTGRYGELGRKLKVSVFLEFRNSEENNLGMPLPKGIMRIYKQDSAGNMQFVGEDRIDHTAEKENVRLKLGQAFDVTAEKIQIDYRKLSGGQGQPTSFETAYRIILRNAKDEAVTVRVEEPLPGDWRILEENLEHRQEEAGAAVWEVGVPAEGKAVLEYRAMVRL